MPDKVQIGIRISEEQKEDWESHVEDSDEHVSLTGLIRTAVSNEINGDGQELTPESPAVTNDIQELQSDIDRIKKDVRWLRNNEQDEVVISDVAQDVYQELEVLPDRQGSVPDDQDSDEEQVAASLIVEGDDGERNPQTKSVLTERLGISDDVFEEAIDHLQEQFLPVIEVELNNRTHYFREE